MHNQRGFSLFAVVFLSIFIVLALVYARPFFEIPYTGYKVQSILAGAIKEGNGKDSEIKRIFDERTTFENLSKVVTSKDLSITNSAGGITVTADYEHCAELRKNWTVCARMSVTR